MSALAEALSTLRDAPARADVPRDVGEALRALFVDDGPIAVSWCTRALAAEANVETLKLRELEAHRATRSAREESGALRASRDAYAEALLAMTTERDALRASLEEGLAKLLEAAAACGELIAVSDAEIARLTAERDQAVAEIAGAGK